MLHDLIIEGTSSAPAVNFQTNGLLKLEGRSMPDNPIQAYKPLFIWTEQLDVPKVIFDIQLYYLNTSSSKQLFSLLQLLEEKQSIQEVEINWHYEADDDDHYETGQLFHEKLSRLKFNFISYT